MIKLPTRTAFTKCRVLFRAFHVYINNQASRLDEIDLLVLSMFHERGNQGAEMVSKPPNVP